MTTRTLRWILPALTTATLLLAAAPVPAAETTDSYELPLKGARPERAGARSPARATAPFATQSPKTVYINQPAAALLPGPNLSVIDLQFSSQRIASGDPECRSWMSNVEVWATVVNTGDENTNVQGWASRILLCPDASLQGCFMNVGAPVEGGLLAPGDTLSLYLTDDFYWVGPGQYYLGVEVDYGNIVFESDETDNKFAIPIQIMDDLPDLSIDNLVAPTSIAIGDNVGGLFGGTMHNLGCAYASGTNRVAYVISADPIIDVNDVQIASYSPAVPAPGTSRSLTSPQALLPIATPQGSVYFGMIVDRLFNISELNEENNFSAAVPITVLPASAAADTSWIYFTDFQSGADGWEPVDFTATENHWNRADYNDGVTTRGVMWCGTYENLVTPPGYGNSWVTTLTKSFPNGAFSIEYSIQYDTEPSYDFVCLQASSDNFASDIQTIRCFDGRNSAFETFADVIPIAGPVSIRFKFTSDGAWSDQDGIWDTDGACRLDYVNVVTGAGTDVATFDNGDDGWEGSGYAGNGILYRLVQDPACDGGFPCDSLYVRVSDDGVTPVRQPINICSAWVAYNDQGVFAYRPNPEAPLTWTGIVSPPIPLPSDGEKYVFRYDVFSNLPLADNLFYTYHVSFDGGPWQSATLVFYGERGWSRAIRDITALRPADAQYVQIRIGATELYYQEGVHTSGGPIFDNVAVGVVNSPSYAGTDVNYLPGACDFDHDGVLDSADACPLENAAPFDKDADGCRDAVLSSRNVEYWLPPTFPVHYSISSQAPAGLNLSEVESEIQAAFNTWTGVSESDASFQYDGTTPAVDAVAGDGVNIVTFNDPDYPFPNGVLAVGVATSYTRRTRVDGVYYRPGQIRDADMIFNPRESFRTPGGGSPTGVDMRSVATHEAGHVLGLSHSSVRSSTMFYVLPQGTNASTLEAEDVSTLRNAYPDALLMANKAELRGFVRDGYSNAGIPGVIVFAISEATGDTTGCTYTLGDGSYQFVGIDPMSVYVAIHALDGSSDIGYITQDNINELIADMDIEPIVAEYYDADESSGDDPNARTAVALFPGGTTTVDIVTNIDSEGPTVISVAPADNALDVPIDAAIRVTFSEAIDIATVGGNLRLRNLTTSALVGGNAAFFDDGRTLSFIPSDYFAFQAPYQLELGPDLADRFGNPLGSPVHSGFVTQARPPVSISSLAPSRGVAGSVLVISGFGFDAVATNNSVTLGATLLTPSTASPTELVVTVPSDTPEGAISLSATNLVTSDVSNAVTFTVLPREDVARGFTTEERVLSATPRAIRVPGAGGWAFVGTDAGISAVDVDRASASYLQQTNIPIVEGVQSLDVTPDGRNLFAVSRISRKIYRVNADPGAGPFGVLAEHTLDEEPLGITIDPAGQTAYIVLGNGLIVIWDVRPGQPTFDQAIGSIDTGDFNLRGKFAIHPSGNRLLLLSGIGKLRVLDLTSRTVTGNVSLGTSPEDVVIDPKGSHAYVTDSDGFVTVIALETMKPVVNLATGGSLRGLAVSPSGSFLFAVDHELNFLDVIDLRATSSSFGTVAERAPTPVDPIDVELSPDGLYAYAIVESGNRIVVTSIGVGPVVRTISRYAGPVGSKVVFSGSGFTEAAQTVVTFNGASVSPERLAEDVVVVSVPAGASSGPALVEGRNPGLLPAKWPATRFPRSGWTSLSRRPAGRR
jgi:DNA-binding beta-propeller fold protein YncE